MVKKLKYLLFFIPFLFTLNVNAAQYDVNAFSAQLYDNRSGSLYSSGTSNTGAAYYGVLNLTGYGTGAAWGVSSPTIILSGHTYALTANVSLGSSNLALSSLNRIGIGTTLDNAKISYQNNTNVDELYSRVVDSDLIQFAFTAKTNASYIVFPFTSTTNTQTDIFLSYILFEDLGVSGVSQTDINTSLNSQTNTINQSITNSQNSINDNSNNNRDLINDNSNNNRDLIIENQNENTDKTNQLLGSCSKNIFNVFDYIYDSSRYTKTDIPEQYAVVLTANNNYSNGSFPLIYHLKLKPSTTYYFKHGSTIAETGGLSYYIYRGSPSGTLFHYTNNSNDFSFTTPPTNYVDYYLQFYVYGAQSNGGRVVIQRPMLFEGTDYNGSYLAYNEEKCTSKLDDNTNAINGLNDSITSEQNPNTNQDINDMNNMVASDTPISDLITMPLTLINAYINGVGASCSPVNLGSLLGTNLTIPCINIQEHIGSNLWNTIDILCCIFLCYEIAMLFISAFDGISSLRDDFEGLYQPKHAYNSYVAKHGGDN